MFLSGAQTRQLFSREERHEVGQTGNRDFCSVQDAVLRFQEGAKGDKPETASANCLKYTTVQ